MRTAVALVRVQRRADEEDEGRTAAAAAHMFIFVLGLSTERPNWLSVCLVLGLARVLRQTPHPPRDLVGALTFAEQRWQPPEVIAHLQNTCVGTMHCGHELCVPWPQTL